MLHLQSLNTMGKAIKVFRKSIHAFLHDYHSLAFIAAMFVFPFSASVLLQSLFPSSSLLVTILYSHIELLFHAANFPTSLRFFSLLNLKLSQTILSFFATLPFTITFLLLAKASVILIVREFPHRQFKPPPLSSILRLYYFLLPTHIFNSFVILSANAAFFSILFVGFNVFDALHLSDGNTIFVLAAASAILYSILIANTMVVCNVATIVSAMERCGGYLPILKACVIIRGREATAITLSLPVNLGMAGIEALFQYRVVNPWRNLSRFGGSMVSEVFLIVYMHSLLIVIDVIISCMMYRSFKKNSRLVEGGVGFYLEFEPEEEILEA